MEQQMLFEERFLDQYTGKKLLRDPVTAVVELVANAWDAGSTIVEIIWPSEDEIRMSIKDNGEGMTEDEFTRRWLTFSYDRLAEQGGSVNIVGHESLSQRRTFGRNGLGRFAAFCFASSYRVVTAKDGVQVVYSVSKSTHGYPIKLNKISEMKVTEGGTAIEILADSIVGITADRVKSEIGMRFLTDPNFQVFVNGDRIDFEDIPRKGIEEYLVNIPGVNEKLRIIMLDAQKTDRTTKQHGVAWQVNGRLVGDCSWQGSGQEALLDGRRIEAKRYTFIIFADILDDPDIIKPDWTGFMSDNPLFKIVQQAVQQKIREILLGLTKVRREETFSNIQRANVDKLRQMTPVSRERWNTFVLNVQEECPSVSERDLEALSGVLANMELSNSRYRLIHKLHELEPSQLDSLHEILVDWNVDAAKTVLDELQWRIQLIDELQKKTSCSTTLEVQELQPLFERGLWIFGPEFETIEFTSNQGMTTVIQSLFQKDVSGSRQRPDFAIIPDGSVGLYSYPEYDDTYEEVGISRLVVIELKKPAVKIGSEQKNQCWGYVKELYEKGCLKGNTRVDCYVLGSLIDQNEADETTHKAGAVKVRPMLFDTVLSRAKSRVLKLYDKVKSAPFLQDSQIDDYLNFSVEVSDTVDLFEAEVELAEVNE